jgi:hypothetical protein
LKVCQLKVEPVQATSQLSGKYLAIKLVVYIVKCVQKYKKDKKPNTSNIRTENS